MLFFFCGDVFAFHFLMSIVGFIMQVAIQSDGFQKHLGVLIVFACCRQKKRLGQTADGLIQMSEHSCVAAVPVEKNFRGCLCEKSAPRTCKKNPSQTRMAHNRICCGVYRTRDCDTHLRSGCIAGALFEEQIRASTPPKKTKNKTHPRGEPAPNTEKFD